MVNYSHSVYSAGAAFVTGKRTEVTTTRIRQDTVRELTNIDTRSDAWGKIIPLGFGRHRVGGALVWASQFYKTTTTFDDETTTKSIVDWNSYQDVHVYDSATGPDHYVVNEPSQVVSNKGSQITHGTMQNALIDLCYSFGKEGDTRKKRYIEKIRINDLVAYDASTSPPYIADGLAFTIRYGYENAPPSLMQKYPNGKFYYPGQTLVCFDQFPLSQFGDAIPSSIDVEWGCCVGETEDPDNGDVHESGWRLRFWLSEWGTQNLETPFKLQIGPDVVQPGGSPSLNLPNGWDIGPDVLVYGTAIVTGTDPRFTPDVNAIKILDGIVTTVGGAPNGSVYRFYRIMSREAFIAYQQSGGIPFYTGNDYVRNDENSNAHGENYYEQNTVAYMFNAISSGKPNINIADRIISVTIDTKDTVSLSSIKGKGRSLYTTQLFRTRRGALPLGTTLKNADGVSLPSFWNGGFSNNRAGGSRNEWLGPGDGDPYYIGAPGEVFTYGVAQGDPPLAATVNTYVLVRNIYASE